MKVHTITLLLFILASFSCRKSFDNVPASVAKELTQNADVMSDPLPVGDDNVTGMVVGGDYHTGWQVYETYEEVVNPFHPTEVYGCTRTYLKSQDIRVSFTKRRTSIIVTIPYEYVVDCGSRQCLKVGGATTATAQAWFNIDGPFLGEITNNYINCYITGSNGAGVLRAAEGYFDGGASEKRTVIISTNGQVKLTGGWSAAGIQVGAEIESGFVVQRAYNDVGTFTFGGNITLTIMQDRPTPYVQSQMSAKFYGTQRDY